MKITGPTPALSLSHRSIGENQQKLFCNFFFLKKRRLLKKLEIWVGGQKAIYEWVGVIFNARGVIKNVF